MNVGDLGPERDSHDSCSCHLEVVGVILGEYYKLLQCCRFRRAPLRSRWSTLGCISWARGNYVLSHIDLIYERVVHVSYNVNSNLEQTTCIGVSNISCIRESDRPHQKPDP